MQDAEIVFLCVGNDQDVEEVVLGEQGILEAMKPGSILVDHTTTSASLAKQIAAEANTKALALSMPQCLGVSREQRSGQLTVMCGGSEPDFAQVESSLLALPRQCS